MFALLLLERWGWIQDGTFMGRVLDEWMVDSQEFVRLKLPHLVVIAGIAFVLVKSLRLITTRMITMAQRHSAGPARLAEVRTLSGVIRATGLVIVGLITGMQILDALGVNLAPLLASAGVAGVALGLAAQNLVKDMLNGIIILLEGQFNVGDRVRMAGIEGRVEEMTLRKSTVRGDDGTLYVIPNSQITTVGNMGVDSLPSPHSSDVAKTKSESQPEFTGESRS